MRALALTALLMANPAAAQGLCFLFCDRMVTLEGDEAAARLEFWLAQALPPGAVVEHLMEGGFQDTYLRARLVVDGADLAAVLEAAGVRLDALAPVSTVEGRPDEPAWWDWKLRRDVTSAEGSLRMMAYTSVHVAPSGPGRWTLYLWAFQT